MLVCALRLCSGYFSSHSFLVWGRSQLRLSATTASELGHFGDAPNKVY
jgi:hypothetical protein